MVIHGKTNILNLHNWSFKRHVSITATHSEEFCKMPKGKLGEKKKRFLKMSHVTIKPLKGVM